MPNQATIEGFALLSVKCVTSLADIKGYTESRKMIRVLSVWPTENIELLHGACPIH